MRSLVLCAFLASCMSTAAPEEKSYVSEASLPEGWPMPDSFGEVVEKTYPAYRAAFTTNEGERGGFWTLFAHIKKEGIPMTAPVEMPMKQGEGGKMSQRGMAFLYQNTQVGEPGPAGDAVEVRDVPEQKALTYAWIGPRSSESVAAARAALDAALAKRGLKAVDFRLLGYNGPSVPRAKRTHELQAILSTKE